MNVASSSADERFAAALAKRSLPYPDPSVPKGLYRPVVIVGSWAITSGHLSAEPDGRIVRGCLGEDMDEEAGKRAAMLAGVNLLANLRAAIGSLDRVKRVLKLTGWIRSVPDFTAHPQVLNGCSELLAEVFGAELGVGARAAVGTAALPLGAAVEVEGIFEMGS